MAIPFLSNINLNGNQALNLALHNKTTPPSNPTVGQIYFDTSENGVSDANDGKVFIWNGTEWNSIAGDITGISITAGAGLTGTVSTTLGDHTQTIDVVGGDGITANADEIEVTVDDVTIELSATDGTGAVQAKTAAVANGQTALATGDQIYDFVIGQLGGYLPLTAGSSEPLSGDLYITHNNAKIVLGNNDEANTANIIEGIGESGKTYIQFGNNQNDGGDEYLRFRIGYNGGSTNDYIFMSASVEEEDLPDDGIKSGNISIGSSVTNFVMDQIYLNAGEVITSDDLTVTGNLVVNGTTTTVESTTVTMTDNILQLNVAAEGDTQVDPVDYSGIEVVRANNDNRQLVWNESTDKWQIETSTDNYENIATAGDIPTVNNGTLTVQGSNGLTGLGTFAANDSTSPTITISHADTSSQASVNNSGRTYIQDITLDIYGHITGITSATETVTNTDTQLATKEADIDVSDTNFIANKRATINHGLNSENVIVQMYDKTTGAVVHADVEHTSDGSTISKNHVRIEFGVVPANDIRVIMIDAKDGATSVTPSYS